MVSTNETTIRMTLKATCSLTGTFRSLPLCTALLALLSFASASGQSSNNNCGTLVPNQYVVGTTCTPIAFNKPVAYTRAYTPAGCNAGNYDDAYGWFKATSTLTTVRYTPQSGVDGILHVLAACGGTVLACSDAAGNGGMETVTITTVIGTNYYVRVQRYGSNSAMNGTLCIFNPGCTYRLNLYDSFGDGWGDSFGGQASVDIRLNGVSIGSYTLFGGSAGYIDLFVSDGDVIQVIFSTTGGGHWIGENSFDLTVGGECVFSTYSPPNYNVPYTTVVNCTPSAAALPQDCLGGATVCGDASITDNNATSGCVMDLNATNRGCLLNGERQGSWYYFSPSVGGTLGFTLVPHGATDDYDFALWGPYDAIQCPNTAPVRCSYFDGRTYNSTTTGMGNGANDTSEGAPRPPNSNNGWVQTLTVVADKIYVLYIDNWSSTGQAFDLSWQLTNGASLDCTTLPVALISLDATTRNTVIDVNWATATEQNSDYFEVQRSADNQSFSPIGTVAAAGDAQYRNDYLFVDQAPLQGANYYRLKQVDRDGTVDKTRTVVAFMGQGNNERPVVFPNPATDVLNVAFNTPLDGSAVLYVQDALGRTVTQSTVIVLRGERTAVIPTAGLANGWYNIRIAMPDGTVQQGGGFLKK